MTGYSVQERDVAVARDADDTVSVSVTIDESAGAEQLLQRVMRFRHGRSRPRAAAQRDEIGAWVHAYLHRVEGDNANAGHWYRRAGKPHSSAPLNEEWDEIVSALLRDG